MKDLACIFIIIGLAEVVLIKVDVSLLLLPAQTALSVGSLELAWHFGIVAGYAMVVYLRLLLLEGIEILKIAQQVVIGNIIKVLIILKRI